MPIKPNLLERTLFFTLNQGPAPLMEIWGGLAFRTVSAAVRLGVFEALSNSPQTVDALAKKLQLNLRGSAILLEALETLGYVIQQNSHYSLTPMAQKWVSPSAEMNFSPYFTFWDVVLRELWQNLEESLRTGEAPTNLYTWIEDHPQVSMDFQQAMIAMARLISGEIAGKLNFLAGVQRLLDVGGGHAEYSIALCNKYPNLKALVFDSHQALVAGRENAAAAGMQGRVEFLEGSFLTNELPGGFDAVLVFNILHGLSADQIGHLFNKVSRSLNPGGRIVIMEQMDEKVPTPASNTVSKLLSLSYFHLLSGKIYSQAEITGWLERAGFTSVQRINMLKLQGNALLLGTKGD